MKKTKSSGRGGPARCYVARPGFGCALLACKLPRDGDRVLLERNNSKQKNVSVPGTAQGSSGGGACWKVLVTEKLSITSAAGASSIHLLPFPETPALSWLAGQTPEASSSYHRSHEAGDANRMVADRDGVSPGGKPSALGPNHYSSVTPPSIRRSAPSRA
ncbi:hypothetical protein VTN02DRAFT_5209 [Thermoascus thermophilus]